MQKQEIIQAIDNGIATAQPSTPDWLAATDALISLFVSHGHPFSSGEIAAHLRTFRPNLRFSVTTQVGAHLRDRFSSGTLPAHVLPDGSVTEYVQVPRVTEGYSRTPPGASVFVYALSEADGRAHPFEVEIPQPGSPPQIESDGLPPIPLQPVTPAAHFVALAPRKAAGSLHATVHTDGRACITRAAFEELLHEVQASLRSGDDVYVSVSPAEIRVSLQAKPGYKAYSLQAARGRILVPHPTTPFQPGLTFDVTVDVASQELVVDIG